jgi:hypothetical protein
VPLGVSPAVIIIKEEHFMTAPARRTVHPVDSSPPVDAAEVSMKTDTEIAEAIIASEDAMPEPEWPLTVVLKKPINVKDKAKDVIIQTLSAIEFREPTAADVVAVGGNPVIVDWNDPSKVTYDAPKMMLMMARLSKQPMTVLSVMGSRDFANCAMMLQRNFLPDLGALI